MTTLEHNIGRPATEPERIMQVVSALPPDTIDALRVIPEVQLRRLEETAKQHGGKVPLHGRLFAQWMHHAYPRECPYPHVTGTTTPPCRKTNGSSGLKPRKPVKKRWRCTARNGLLPKSLRHLDT